MYEPIYPQSLFCSEYAEKFRDTVIRRLKHYSVNRERKARNNHTVTVHREKIYAPALYDLIHYRKLPGDILSYFNDRSFIEDYNRGGWMSIDSHVASIYMRTLAEYSVKCHSEDMVIGTDSRKNQRSLYRGTRRTPSAMCISMELSNCLPQVDMGVSYEDLIDFKLRHQTELLALRRRLGDFEQELAGCESREQARFYTERFKESWQLELRQMQKAARGSRVAFSLGSLVALIGVPSAAGYYTQRLEAPEIAKIAILGGVAGITVCERFIDYRNKVNEKRSGAGFSYILEAKKSGIIDL